MSSEGASEGTERSEGGRGGTVSLGDVREVVELLENLQESVDKYYAWASLLQEEFREIKRRVGAIEDALLEDGGWTEEGDGDDIEGRLARLRAE